jgi:hypothetical protein
MERAARLIKKNKYSRQMISDEDIVRGLWASAVGPAIARHTCRLKIVRSTLIVEVEDAVWQKQLSRLSHQVAAQVRKLTGSGSIEEVEFRVGVPKREMMREERVTPVRQQEPVEPRDESDQIQDPVLKKVYRLSRKRAIA